jgi:hypothetical protein
MLTDDPQDAVQAHDPEGGRIVPVVGDDRLQETCPEPQGEPVTKAVEPLPASTARRIRLSSWRAASRWSLLGLISPGTILGRDLVVQSILSFRSDLTYDPELVGWQNLGFLLFGMTCAIVGVNRTYRNGFAWIVLYLNLAALLLSTCLMGLTMRAY